jgi:hypothetical protein
MSRKRAVDELNERRRQVAAIRLDLRRELGRNLKELDLIRADLGAIVAVRGAEEDPFSREPMHLRDLFLHGRRDLA